MSTATAANTPASAKNVAVIPQAEMPATMSGTPTTLDKPLPAMQMHKGSATSAANQRCMSIEAGTVEPIPQVTPRNRLPTQAPSYEGMIPQTAKPAARQTTETVIPARIEIRPYKECASKAETKLVTQRSVTRSDTCKSLTAYDPRR